MENSQIIEALEACLEQIKNGASLEQALRAYPQWAEELRPLLLAAQSAQAYGKDIHVPQAAQARSKAGLLQAARQRSQARSEVFAWRFGLALVAFLLVFASVVATTAAVSARALPGEALYSVKIASERTRLLLAGAPLKKLELEQSFDEERVHEVEALSQRYHNTASNHPQEVTFAANLTQMQPREWLVGGVRVIVGPQITTNSAIQPGDYIEVQGMLQPDGSVLASQVQERQVDISGKLEAIETNNWIISGITFVIHPETQILGAPTMGATVHVHAFWLPDGSLLAQLIEVTGGVIASPMITFTPLVPTEEIQPSQIPESTETEEPEATPQPTQNVEPTESPEPTESELKTPMPTEASHETPEPTKVKGTGEPGEPTEIESTYQPRPTENESTHEPYNQPTSTLRPTEDH